MPQFLAETTPAVATPLDINGRALHTSHEQLVSILRSRLGANHADLLAAPKVQADGSIRWSTSLAGPVVRATELDPDARQKLQQRADRITGDIRGLARQMADAPGPSSALVARTLELAVERPSADWLFSVDGKPVVVLWGHVGAGAPLPAAATAVPVVAAPVSPPPAAAVRTPAAPPPLPDLPFALPETPAAPGDGPVQARGRAGRGWLAWVALLVAAAALLWAITRCTPGDDGAADPQLGAAEKRNQELEAELARKIAAPAAMQCVADPPPAAASAPPVPPAASAPEPPASAASQPPPPASAAPPPVKASAPPPKASAPERKPPSPREALEKKISDAGDDCEKLGALLQKPAQFSGSNGDLRGGILQTMQKRCPEKAIAQARNACPGERPPELAPEVAIVFDASGSMNYSLDATAEDIARANMPENPMDGLVRGLFGLPPGPDNRGAIERATREPKRITIARDATLAVARRLPSDMSVGLVMVDSCPAARNAGKFGPAERGGLLSAVQGIAPRRGTPLADGIAKGAALVDGVTREGIIVVVSDGEESCRGDPCAVAAAIKRDKPFVKINVVDITGTGAGNCVAEATGGKVFTANNADELVAMTNRAAQDAMGPANCRKP